MRIVQWPKLVTSTSALRRVPIAVADDDKVVLDGIRYSLEVADRAYKRLRETLWEISRNPEAEHVELYADVVSDAWTVVDSLNRLREMCEAGCSFLEHDFYRSYAETLKQVILLRNSHQHMKGRLEKIIADKESAWGVISWFSLAENPPTHIDGHSLIAGTLRSLENLTPEVPQHKFHMPVDAITMRSQRTEVPISQLMRATEEFAHQLDRDLTNLFPTDALHGRDAYTRVTYKFTESNVRAPRLTLAIKHVDAPPMNRAARRKASQKK